MWYKHDGVQTHVSRALSITAIMSDGYVNEDPLHGLYARQIAILWIFACGNIQAHLYMQLLLTTKSHFIMTLWTPVRPSTTAPASLNGCGSP
jgi:hypothetical protein